MKTEWVISCVGHAYGTRAGGIGEAREFIQVVEPGTRTAENAIMVALRFAKDRGRAVEILTRRRRLG